MRVIPVSSYPQRTFRLLASITILSLLAAVPLAASSHREAPFVTEHPKVDGTDFYMFRSYEEGRDGFVTLIADYLPLQDAYGGPNYFTLDPSARYRVNIENDGAAGEDLIFEFQFFNILNHGALTVDGVTVEHPLRTITPLTPGVQPNEAELYVVRVIRGQGAPQFAVNGRTGDIFFAKALDYFGDKTFADYETYAERRITPIQIPGCGDGKVFVGQRKEPFAVNLGEIFDLVNLNPVGDPAAKRSATEDKNVTALALEVPIDCLTGGHGPVIGGWTTARLPRTSVLSDDPTFDQPADESSDFVQVSRLGMPLVNEVVIGLKDKNKFNASRPQDDLANFATYVTNPSLAEILEVVFGVRAPNNFPRADLVAAFVTGFAGVNDLGVGEMQRLNTAIDPTPKDDQSNFGVAGGDLAGFPNGRRPGDDVVDISLRVVMGVLCHPIAALGNLDLGLCDPADAPDGLLPYTDQTYQGPDQFDAVFPYLRTPVAGSPNRARKFCADLDGRQEVPANDSTFSGACTGLLNDGGSELLLTCTHDVANPTAGHVHLAPPGVAGPIICPFPGNAASPIQVVCPLTPDLLAALQQGNTYVNIHTAANPPGEIRGQLR
jgi:Domain of unknown function (DUF4331)/CHRD domain